ncbi:hypothetical protein BC831DRAFT_515547 [Entophlyctis helioformis]|nr:hypothetical protein BC831DRAFT_515547 [Entophlyctis helioformis]
MSDNKTAAKPTTVPETEESGYSISSLTNFVNVLSALTIAAGIVTMLSPGIYWTKYVSGAASILVGILGLAATANPTFAKSFSTIYNVYFFVDTTFALLSALIFVTLPWESTVDACARRNGRWERQDRRDCEEARATAFNFLLFFSIFRFAVQCVCVYYVDQYARKIHAQLALDDAEMGTAPSDDTAKSAAPASLDAPAAPQPTTTTAP